MKDREWKSFRSRHGSGNEGVVVGGGGTVTMSHYDIPLGKISHQTVLAVIQHILLFF